MRAARVHIAQFPAGHRMKCIMGDWAVLHGDWEARSYPYDNACCYADKPMPPPPPPPPRRRPPVFSIAEPQPEPPPLLQRMENPRELRKEKEKQRRDKLNQSIAELASMVPPVLASTRKIDKTGVLRLTAHYLRAYQYVFGDTLRKHFEDLKPSTVESILNLLNGFLLTTTYRGLIVVVSQNVHQFLGYKELDLLGQNVINIIHPDDQRLMLQQLTPKLELLGPKGELLVPGEPDERKALEDALTQDHRQFVVRFKKQGQRGEPVQYVTCHIEGSFRKSDRANRGLKGCCQMVRRPRARSDNPCSSGNDVVFIGVVRPTMETFLSERRMEYFKMEYRTRHSVDGEIIQCEQRISLITGYMTNEVYGVNAMNFMHKDDVSWVIIALREMYVNKRLAGESCYRLMTKNGQFIYMRTRGCLDVDEKSRAVTTFVCTNNVVHEQEGKQLIRLMKKKFTMRVNNNEIDPTLQIREDDNTDSKVDRLQVTTPKQLQKEILHLVTDLPSPISANSPGHSDCTDCIHGIAIIPPRKERIVSAIQKMYTVIRSMPKESSIKEQEPPNVATDQINQFTQTEKPSRNVMAKRNPTSEPPAKRLATTFEDAFMNCDPEPTFINPEVINVEEYEETRALNRSMQPMALFTANASASNGNSQFKPNPNYGQMGLSSTAIPDDSADLDSHRSYGLKRPIDTTENNGTLKRKTAEVKQSNAEENVPPFNLDVLLNEAILNTGFPSLDTALESLEEPVDPAFPDLLSNEVQDILKTIDDDPGEGLASGT